MHFPTCLLSLLPLLPLAAATIGYGHNDLGQPMAFIANGEDLGDHDANCFGAVISTTVNDNPCGKPFTLSNGVTFQFQGCGGNQFRTQVSDGNGGFVDNAACVVGDEFFQSVIANPFREVPNPSDEAKAACPRPNGVVKQFVC